MNEREWFQIAAYVGLLITFTPLLGGFMARVFSGERTFLTPLFSPVERWIFRPELSASFREPDTADKLFGNARHPPGSGGADLHLRHHDQFTAAGLGDIRGDDDFVSWRPSRRVVRGIQQQSGFPEHRKS